MLTPRARSHRSGGAGRPPNGTASSAPHPRVDARLAPWHDLPPIRRLALEVFLDGYPHTRSEIAAAVGQSAPSATGHIEALIERGLVAPVDEASTGGRSAAGSRSSSPGRPATSYRLRPERALALGMELRPSIDERAPAHLTSRVIRLDGSVVTERHINLPTEALRSIRSVVLEEARRTIAEVEHGSAAGTASSPGIGGSAAGTASSPGNGGSAAGTASSPGNGGSPAGNRPATGAPVVGVGLALPGVVDCEEQLLIHAPNLFLSRVSFAGLAEELRRPVYIDNEANAAALAEYVLLGGATDAAAAGEPSYAQMQPPTGSFVRISITEGVGAGIIVDGRLMRGDTWRAGEFGHMAIRDGNRRCNCGRTGCWEQYVSERALLREARAAGLACGDVAAFIDLLAAGHPRGRHAAVSRADRRGGGSHGDAQYRPAGGGSHGDTQYRPAGGGSHGDAQYRPAGGGSPAEKVWNRYIDALAVGIENVAACVDPGTIIVGGTIAAAGELLVAPLRQAVEAVSFLTSGIRVTGSALPASAPVTGAALLGFGDLYPAAWGDRPPGGGAGAGLTRGDQGRLYASTAT